jgi:CHAT domain-containing protein
MRQFLIFLILCVLSFDISAQEIPKNLNAYDLDGNKTGDWTILYDLDWNVTESIDSAKFYRVITYERGSPSGKVVDYEVSGIKMWEGFLYSDSPIREYFGKNTWFFDDGSILETAFFKDSVLDGVNVVYNKNGDTCLIIYYSQGVIQNHKIYTIDSTSNKEFLINKFHDLYNQYYELEMYNTQLEVSYILLKLGDELYAEKDSSYLFILENLYTAYYETGYYQKALDLILRLEKLYGEVFGYESGFYISTLSQIAASYNDIGDYNTSLEYSLKSMEKTKLFFGENSYEYAIELNNTGYYYNILGNLVESFELSEKSLKIRKNIFGKNSKEYSIALGNVAGNYRNLGDIEQSRKMYEEQLEINKIIFGVDHTSTALTQFYLSGIYIDLDLERSLDFCLDAMSIFENKLGKNSYYYTLALGRLSDNYYMRNNIDTAIIIEEQCIKLRKEVFSPCHRELLTGLLNITDLYNQVKDFNKSLSILQEVLLLADSCHGIYNEIYIKALEEIAVQYYILNENNKASEYFSSLISNQMNIYMDLENSFDESLLQIKLNELKEYFEYSFDVSSLEEHTYNLWYFLKGRELSKKLVISNIVYSSNDSLLINLFETVQKLNDILYESYENPSLLSSIERDSIINLSKYNERKLISACGNIDNNRFYWKDVIENLSNNEVHVDIFKGLFDISPVRISEESYYAYITKKGYLSPELVYLGSESYFDSIYNYYSNYTQERPSNKEFSYRDIFYGNICYQNFWSKLEPYLEGVSTVYFSSEGVYSKINSNVLYDSTTSSFLMDKYDIVYVSNVEDFVHQKENIQLYERPDDLYAVLVGNPTFLLEDDVVVLASNEPQSRSINQDELDSLQRGMLLSDLPGTQMEVDLISDNLKSKGWNVELISGVDATETRVKNIEAPKILHIATHGFFFKDQEMVKRSNMISKDNKKAVANPMTRSGLMFSGAENTMNGEILADDNGWLNSYEASLLNLRGTELVVLSACETGTGDVQNGKGVYGLQRAIRVAGAESLIMSMWEVDDKATQELMTYFYDYWIDKNMTKKDAFNKAQEKIREKYKHPYYWGAFIMLGE